MYWFVLFFSLLYPPLFNNYSLLIKDIDQVVYWPDSFIVTAMEQKEVVIGTDELLSVKPFQKSLWKQERPTLSIPYNTTLAYAKLISEMIDEEEWVEIEIVKFQGKVMSFQHYCQSINADDMKIPISVRHFLQSREEYLNWIGNFYLFY